MSRRPYALFLTLIASPLMADVTPEQVWQGWQDSAAAIGNEVSAESVVREGDALVLKNLRSSNPEGGTARLEGTFRLRDDGDGTVTILMPDTCQVAVHVPSTAGAADKTATDLGFEISMQNAKTAASGTPDAVRYQTDVAALDLTPVTVNNVAASEIPVAAAAHVTGVSATYGMATSTGTDAARKLAEEFSVKTINIAIKGKDTKDEADYDITASLADLAGKIGLNIPAGMDMKNAEAAFAKGFSVAGALSLGATTFDIIAHDAGKLTQINGTTGSASFDMAMDAERMTYASDSKTVALKVVTPDIPLDDASLSYKAVGLSFAMPVSASDKPADFMFRMNLTDVAPSEVLWALIDPGKAMKHDPVTLVLDTKGKVTLTRSLLDDATALETGQTDSPGVLNAFDLDQFQAKAAGAEVTANGSFTFDNSDMTTYEGIPAPTGKIGIKALGVNALIDTLVKIGVVPKERAIQGRMVLAMFADTKPGADEMTSTLEFKDKHFFANGQQLQ